MRQEMNYLDSLTQLKKDERIYLYGAGSFSEIFLNQLQYWRKDIKIVNLIDKTKKVSLIILRLYPQIIYPALTIIRS